MRVVRKAAIVYRFRSVTKMVPLYKEHVAMKARQFLMQSQRRTKYTQGDFIWTKFYQN